MNRMLSAVLFLSVFLAAATGVAEAKATRAAQKGPETVIINYEQLPHWVQNEGRRMLHSRHRNAHVKDMLFVGDFPDTGDVIRLTQAAIDTAGWFGDMDYLCGQGVLPIGCSSPRHYDSRRSTTIMSEFFNTLLGPPRANTLASTMMTPDEPYNGTITGYRPGVLLVFYDNPPVDVKEPTTSAPPAIHDPSVGVAEAVLTLWVRPSVGVAGTWLTPQRVLTPTGGVAGGTHFGKYVVGMYAVAGQDFQPQNRGTAAYGVQFGSELGASVRLGYRSTWTELRGDGHTTERAEGGEIGIGYGFPVCRVGLGVAILQYANLNDRGGKYLPAITFNLDLGPLFQAK